MEDSTKVVALGFLVALERREIWLAEKKTGIGSGKLNGYGGGCKQYEDIHDCIIREFNEESGATTKKDDLIYAGYIVFKRDNEGEQTTICTCYIFFITNQYGDMRETKEMGIPKPFCFDGIPFNKMMPSDELWLPKVLIERKTVSGVIVFDKDMKNVLGNDLHFK